MSESWPTVRLAEVLKLDVDRVPIDPSFSYPMVGVLSFGRGLFDREAVVNGNTSYKFFYRLAADHFVMSQLFGWEGALALSNDAYAGKYLSPQFPTFRCDSERLDRRYLGWLARRPTLWDELGLRASGMGDRRRTLNPEALLAIEVALPPVEQQRRIVARIEAIASKVEEASQLQGESEEMSDNVCRSILSHAATVQSVSMASLVQLRPTDVEVQATDTYQFAGVYSFGRGVFRSVRKSGSEFSYRRLTTLRAGDFVYPKLMAWEGALGVVPPECDGCVVSPEFPTFQVDASRVLPEVLDVHFRTPAVWPNIATLSTGTNVRRRRVHPRAFLTYKMPLPDMDTQRSMVAARQALNRASGIRTSLQSELDAILPAVLDRALKAEM